MLSDDLLRRIEIVTKRQLSYEPKIELFVSTTEELGEYARAIAIESGSKTNAKLDEPARMEAIDILLCAYSLYIAEGGTPETLLADLDKKLTKWENVVDQILKNRDSGVI